MTNPLRSLATRITLLVFVATVASSTAVTWISLQSLDGFLRSKVDERFPEIAQRITHELDGWYSHRIREIEVFADSSILTETLPQLDREGRHGDRARNDAEQYLRYVLESFPHFERLVIAHPEGRPLLEVGHDQPLPPDFLASHATGTEAPSISSAHHFGTRIVQIASTPIADASGRATARLFALIDFERLTPMLTSDELGDSAHIFMIDEANRYLNPPEGVDPGTLHPSPDTASESEGHEAHSILTYHDDLLNMEVVGTHSSFPRFGWTLVVEQPYDEAFAPVVASMSRVIGLNVAIVLACGLVAFRLAGSIVQPLRALSRAARRLSEGEREVLIDESSSSDEVGLLTRTFNDMSRALGRITHELEENHRAIESANEELVTKNEELSEMNLVLEQLSITDGLTKLHNHRYFQDAMAQACKRSLRTREPLSLLLVDIDYFKRWNDRLGHAAGDEILRRLAETLNESVRDTDLVARYGGEEFAVLATDTDIEGATALGEKVRIAVSEAEFVTDVPSEKEGLTVSVGAASFQGDRKQLFTDADAALYRAKRAGRDCVVAMEPEMESVPDSTPERDTSDAS